MEMKKNWEMGKEEIKMATGNVAVKAVSFVSIRSTSFTPKFRIRQIWKVAKPEVDGTQPGCAFYDCFLGYFRTTLTNFSMVFPSVGPLVYGVIFQDGARPFLVSVFVGSLGTTFRTSSTGFHTCRHKHKHMHLTHTHVCNLSKMFTFVSFFFFLLAFNLRQGICLSVRFSTFKIIFSFGFASVLFRFRRISSSSVLLYLFNYICWSILFESNGFCFAAFAASTKLLSSVLRSSADTSGEPSF